MEIPYKVVPIVEWPGEQTTHRGRSQFRADFTDTLRLLRDELEKLDVDPSRTMVQMAVNRSDIRVDGTLRANARRASHPGVILTFETEHGPVIMPCDTYESERDNLRAIALSLKALRSVNRYGVTKKGEQYRGFGALPPAGGSSAKMTARTAAEIMLDVVRNGIGSYAFDHVDADAMLADHHVVITAYRVAARFTHPDKHGGDGERFRIVNAAKTVLDEHHRVNL